MTLEARLLPLPNQDLLASYESLRNGGYDELAGRRRRGAPALGELPRRALSTSRPPSGPTAPTGSTGACARWASRTTSSPTRPTRESGGRSISSRSSSPAPQWRELEAGAGAARQAVQRHSRRRLRRAAPDARGDRPAGARLLRSRLPERLPGHCPGRRPSAVLRRRRRARCERRLARHRQSHRDAGRRRLRARQPRRCTPTSPAISSRSATRCGSRRSSSACRRASPC